MAEKSFGAQLLEDLSTIRQWSVQSSGVTTAEIDNALMIIGDGASVIPTGVQGCWMFDFNALITGWFIQEFDGTSGTISLNLYTAARGASPTFTSIVASAPPAISSSGRYNDSDTLPMTGWATTINRGTLLRLNVASVTLFKRLLISLRIRRLEP